MPGPTGARVEGARAALDAGRGALPPDRADGVPGRSRISSSHRASCSQQLVLRQQAQEAANLVEQQVLNRYQAGQVSYTEVVTAQVTALNARRAVVQAQSDRQVAAVALIQALGGGWRGL